MCKDITEALLEDVIEITWMFDSLMHKRKIPQWNDIIDDYGSDGFKDVIKRIARQFEEKYPFETAWIDTDLIYLEEIQTFSEEKLLEEFHQNEE